MDIAESISYTDFANICRVCLYQNNLVHLQEVTYLVDIFINVTDIQVKIPDELPQNICNECVQKLQSISNFINLSHKNDALLHKILNSNIKPLINTSNLSIQNDIKIEPIDIDFEDICKAEDEQIELDSTQQLYQKSTETIKKPKRKRFIKKVQCPFCLQDVAKLSRHLISQHKKEDIVKEIQTYPPRHPQRNILIESIRRKGNFLLHKNLNTIRPIRTNKQNYYLSCDLCLGFYSNNSIAKHRKDCKFKKEASDGLTHQNHWAKCLIHTLCSGPQRNFYNSLKLTKKVFPYIHNDYISKIAINDRLICFYGEYMLPKGPVVNSMRLLARMLIELKNTTGLDTLEDYLSTEYYKNFISAARTLCRYNSDTQRYKFEKLALRIGDKLSKLCKVAASNEKHFTKTKIEDIEQLGETVNNYWNEDITNQMGILTLINIIDEIKKFYDFIAKEANKAVCGIEAGVISSYQKLSECVLTFTILFNRKRTKEIEYILLSTYKEKNSPLEDQILNSLSESEKLQSRHFKKVISYGKNCKPVTILFPEGIQDFINILIKYRDRFVSECNNFLFADAGSNAWMQGDDVIKSLVDDSGVDNVDLFVSRGYREEVATILQVLNMSEEGVEEFLEFLSAPDNQYRITEDSYQTAIASTILMALNRGQVERFKGKAFEDIKFYDCNSDLLNAKNEYTYSSVKEKIDKSTTEETEWGPVQVEEISENNVTIKTEYDRPRVKKTTAVNKKRSVKRKEWTSKQRNLIKSYFKDCIKNKEAPRKRMVEEFISKHKDVFEGRNWVIIKAFVYNCYRDKILQTNIPQKKRWTSEQQELIKEHFHESIKNKESPRKWMVEEFIAQHRNLFEDRNWVVIKTFVYNCYKDK